MRKALTVANILICLFMLSPILVTIPASFGDAEIITALPDRLSLRWYRNFFATPELVSGLLLSLRLAAASTLASLAIGLPASIALTRYRIAGRNAIRSLALSPIVVPGLILGLALLLFFTRAGLAGSFFSLLLAHSVICLPYAIRTLSAGLQGMDESLVQAAMSLGATPLTALRTVTLPLLKAALLASGIFAFVTSLDELVVTLFLTGPRLSTLPVEMFNYIEVTSDPTIAAASVLLILVTSVTVLVLERLVGFGEFS